MLGLCDCHVAGQEGVAQVLGQKSRKAVQDSAVQCAVAPGGRVIGHVSLPSVPVPAALN